MVRNKTTPSDSRQSKNFCFTLNNYTTEEHEAIKQWFVSSSIYSIIGEEVGEEGTRHLQGYCSLKAKTRFPSIKIHLSPRAHIEYAREMEVLTSYIALKAEYSGSMVYDLNPPLRSAPATPSPSSGLSHSERVERAFKHSLPTIQVPMPGPDIFCYETLSDSPVRNQDQRYGLGGSTDPQV